MTEDISAKYLDQDLLKQVFVHNLNRLYFGKCYLNGQLQELIELASFNSLKLGLQEFGDDIKKQIERMHGIYKFIDEAPSDKNCNPLKSIVRDKFCLDDKQDMTILTDTDIILYIQMLEHINIAACRLLTKLSVALSYTDVQQLLTECFDESVDNDLLFNLITNEYICID
jgi:ferritin-like metal-binding protein YciE